MRNDEKILIKSEDKKTSVFKKHQNIRNYLTEIKFTLKLKKWKKKEL